MSWICQKTILSFGWDTYSNEHADCIHTYWLKDTFFVGLLYRLRLQDWNELICPSMLTDSCAWKFTLCINTFLCSTYVTNFRAVCEFNHLKVFLEQCFINYIEVLVVKWNKGYKVALSFFKIGMTALSYLLMLICKLCKI